MSFHLTGRYTATGLEAKKPEERYRVKLAKGEIQKVDQRIALKAQPCGDHLLRTSASSSFTQSWRKSYSRHALARLCEGEVDDRRVCELWTRDRKI